MSNRIFNQSINRYGDIPLVRLVKNKDFEAVQSALADTDAETFKKSINAAMQSGKNIMHHVIASQNKKIMQIILQKMSQHLNKDEMTAVFQQLSNSGYNPIDQLLDADNPNESLKTFLEAVNDTGDADLLQAVFDAKGWAADDTYPVPSSKKPFEQIQNEGPTLMESIKAMDNGSLKTELLDTVRDSLQGFAYKHGNYFSNYGEKEIIGHSKETKADFKILDENFPDEAGEIKKAVEEDLFRFDIGVDHVVAGALVAGAVGGAVLAGKSLYKKYAQAKLFIAAFYITVGETGAMRREKDESSGQYTYTKEKVFLQKGNEVVFLNKEFTDNENIGSDYVFRKYIDDQISITKNLYEEIMAGESVSKEMLDGEELKAIVKQDVINRIQCKKSAKHYVDEFFETNLKKNIAKFSQNTDEQSSQNIHMLSFAPLQNKFVLNAIREKQEVEVDFKKLMIQVALIKDGKGNTPLNMIIVTKIGEAEGRNNETYMLETYGNRKAIMEYWLDLNEDMIINTDNQGNNIIHAILIETNDNHDRNLEGTIQFLMGKLGDEKTKQLLGQKNINSKTPLEVFNESSKAHTKTSKWLETVKFIQKNEDEKFSLEDMISGLAESEGGMAEGEVNNILGQIKQDKVDDEALIADELLSPKNIEAALINFQSTKSSDFAAILGISYNQNTKHAVLVNAFKEVNKVTINIYDSLSKENSPIIKDLNLLASRLPAMYVNIIYTNIQNPSEGTCVKIALMGLNNLEVGKYPFSVNLPKNIEYSPVIEVKNSILEGVIIAANKVSAADNALPFTTKASPESNIMFDAGMDKPVNMGNFDSLELYVGNGDKTIPTQNILSSSGFLQWMKNTYDFGWKGFVYSSDIEQLRKIAQENDIAVNGENLRSMYKKMVLKFHPDKNHASEAKNKFIKTQEVFDKLNQPIYKNINVEKIANFAHKVTMGIKVAEVGLDAIELTMNPNKDNAIKTALDGVKLYTMCKGVGWISTSISILGIGSAVYEEKYAGGEHNAVDVEKSYISSPFANNRNDIGEGYVSDMYSMKITSTIYEPLGNEEIYYELP